MHIFVITSKSTQEKPNFGDRIRDLYFEEIGGYTFIDNQEQFSWVSQQKGNLSDRDYIYTCIAQISRADKVIYLAPHYETATDDAILIQLLYSRLLKKPMQTAWV